jgi:CRP-like cAMP-binding protein
VNLDPSAFVADPQLIKALESRSTTVACDNERVLFRQGDDPVGLYLVHKGEVTITMDSRKANATLSFQAAAGSLLGLPGLIGNEPYTLTAVARTGAQLSFVTRDSFLALMQSDPMLSMKVLQVLAAEVRTARNAIFHL